MKNGARGGGASEEARLRREIRRSRRRARRAVGAATARSAALANLSHEMREPLNAVVGMSRLLGETRLDPEQRGYIEAITASAESLATLVNDLLDLARIDAGAVQFAEVEFSPAHLLANLRAMFEPRARAKSLGFEVTWRTPPAAVVRGDAGRLRQVLVNLLGNALKFTHAGHVAVGAAMVPGAGDQTLLEVTIADTGIGMPDGVFERLTRPFTQADPSIARSYGGSGLGLLIARRLLEAMGGGLACASRPGAGTRFTLRCPVRPAATSAAGPMPASLAGLALLVADRRERSRTFLRDLALLWGMEARVAASGREVLLQLGEAAARNRPFDILLLAADLRDPSAHEIARRVRADPATSHVRLALLAETGLRGDAARAEAAGFQAYLTQPADADLVRACLQRLAAPAQGQPLLTVHGLIEKRRPVAVLVVDDNPLNCRLAQILLGKAGHEVTTAPGGPEALALLAGRPFDLVLMDVQMPGMDGLETARRIRALGDAQRARVPIVAVTASAMQGDDARCREAGMDAFLPKPIDGAALVATVERLAAGRPEEVAP